MWCPNCLIVCSSLTSWCGSLMQFYLLTSFLILEVRASLNLTSSVNDCSSPPHCYCFGVFFTKSVGEMLDAVMDLISAASICIAGILFAGELTPAKQAEWSVGRQVWRVDAHICAAQGHFSVLSWFWWCNKKSETNYWQEFPFGIFEKLVAALLSVLLNRCNLPNLLHPFFL